MISDKACVEERELQHQNCHREWTEMEDRMLIELHAEFRPKWKLVQSRFDQRTSFLLKDRRHSVLKGQQSTNMVDLERRMALRMVARACPYL
jgi:hypothetical protein